jgi:hypothetical protein
MAVFAVTGRLKGVRGRLVIMTEDRFDRACTHETADLVEDAPEVGADCEPEDLIA